jgi:hypothetical protein
MNTKLTLRLDEDLIRGAKRYAGSSGKTVSRLVADYFALLAADEELPPAELTPRVRSLLGSLENSGLGEEDYRRHLEDKYS